MIHIVKGVLPAAELDALAALLAGARFGDGRHSAGTSAREQKHVLQLERTGDEQREAGELVARALLRHPVVQAAALPRSVRHPTIIRYESGMYYGPHLDAPIMGGAVPLRADLSVTVFLSEPSSYVGGELVVSAAGRPERVKAAAGDAVLYPSGAIHEVLPVESGVRLVAVTWMQSLVKGSEQRRLLLDLSDSIALLEQQGASAEALLRLRRTHGDLLRRWAET